VDRPLVGERCSTCRTVSCQRSKPPVPLPGIHHMHQVASLSRDRTSTRCGSPLRIGCMCPYPDAYHGTTGQAIGSGRALVVVKSREEVTSSITPPPTPRLGPILIDQSSPAIWETRQCSLTPGRHDQSRRPGQTTAPPTHSYRPLSPDPTSAISAKVSHPLLWRWRRYRSKQTPSAYG